MAHTNLSGPTYTTSNIGYLSTVSHYITQATGNQGKMEMSGWQSIKDELEAWRAEAKEAPMWWRDDDAASITPELERLLRLGEKTGLGLAVIPATTDDELIPFMNKHPRITVIQHGYAHLNHARPGNKKIEMGGDRNPDDILRELALGWECLENFKYRLPVLVPPWNRIEHDLVCQLPMLGLSTFGRRDQLEPAPGLIQANTHVDIIDWQSRSFVGELAALAAIVRHLSESRISPEDNPEPTGILTHHLVHDDKAWDFLEKFVESTTCHSAVRWLCPREVFWP